MNTNLRKKSRQLVYLLGFVILSLAFFGCSDAQTLGDSDVDQVVIAGTPTWENGVGRLMRIKCASCHTVPHNDLTPDQAPKDLDLRNFQGHDGVRGAQDIATWINRGVLRQGVDAVRRMPLDYGTPLTAHEKEKLEQWVSLGVPLNLDSLIKAQAQAQAAANTAANSNSAAALATSVARGSELFALVSMVSFKSCANCHGPAGVANAAGFKPILFAPDLRFSALPAQLLASTIERMWQDDGNAGNGAGTYSKLPEVDKTALHDYVLSLKKQ